MPEFRVLTSGIHAVRGLQGGRCVCIGMDVLQWVCTRGRDMSRMSVSLWSACIG